MATKSIRLSDGTDTLLPESAVSASGYQKNADGTLIQWGFQSGIVTPASGTASATVNFAVQFNVNYIVSVVAVPETQLAQYFRSTVSGISPTAFVINTHSTYTSSASLTVRWLAIGRWK